MNVRLAVFGLALCGAMPVVNAMPGNLANGSNLTTAGVSIDATPPSTVSNPALLKQSLGDKNWALQGFRLPSIAVEIGPVDNFVDTLDNLEEQINAVEADGIVTVQEFSAIEQQFSGVLKEIGDKANLTLDVSMPVPALPVVFKAFDGTMAVHLSVSASAGATVIDGPIEFDLASEEILTNSAVYLRAGEFYEAAVDYGRDVMPFSMGKFDGTVSVGGRVKLIQGSLSRQLASVDGRDGDTAFDRVGDNYDLNKETSTALGADIGVAFVADEMSLGLSLRNLIPAKFDFSTLGVNCGSKPAGSQRDDCNASRQFIQSGEASAGESFKLDPQLAVEAGYVLGSGFTAFSTLELNKVENIAGHDYQWLNLGVNYAGPWWIPAVRLGWRSNLAGSKLDMLSFGINLFNVINLEAFQALDSVDYDGDSVPRAAGISIGIGGRF